jgi:predicted enzyme related to lactoylglutathione lyase
LANVRGERVAAIYAQMEDERGVPPHWSSYVTVASADRSAAHTKELGGIVAVEPFDVMTAGRMAVIADPTGAVLGLWQAGDATGAGRVNEPGCLTWNELATNDVEAASSFYSGLFGWTIEEIDTGGGPRYRTIGHEGGASGRNGGIRELGPGEQGIPPSWVPYLATESVDESAAQAEQLGGGTVVPPTAVPGGKFAGLRDAQGAVFSIFEGEFDD